MDVVWWCFACTLITFGQNHCVNCAQILALMPIAGTSHWNVVDAVLQTLVARGHNVTAVTPFPTKHPVANYTELDMSQLMPTAVNLHWTKIMNQLAVANNIPFLSGRHQQMCKAVFERKEFWHILHSNKYDLCITELLASSCDVYVPYYLKVPHILIVPSHILTWYHHTFASHLNPSHISTYNAPFAVPKTFIQRMANVYDYVYSHIVFKWVDREATAIGRKYFGSDAPDADTLMRNASLVFVNGHFSVDLPKPLLPNFVDIGGIHLVPPNPLPLDLEQFINDSPDGIIYFTLGSIIKMETTPGFFQKLCLEAFREIPQRVLWKYESQSIEELPNNVKIEKWFPQRDILAHKNVKLFISHCGMSGIYEAINSGIPVLGIPVFFDQPHNMANIVHWGAGIMLNHKTLTKEIFLNAIKEIMTNYSKYKSNAMELSKRFKDRPKTQREEVIYWTEYVLNHKGAHHLKSSGLNLPWYQYFLIDILITIVFILLAILSVIFIVIKSVKHLMCRLIKFKKD